MKKFILSLALVCGFSMILPAQVESLSRDQKQNQNQTQEQVVGKELPQERKLMPEKPLLKVFDSLYHLKSGENVMLSAWGIQECFGMICGGAGSKSAAELSRVLGIDDQTAVWLDGARTSLQQSYEKFNSFNAVFYNQKLSLQKSFAAHTADLYKGSLIPTDFSKPEEAVRQLNECVKRESAGKLDHVFKKQDVLGDPAMILLNVLFFKGEWQRPFEPHRTWRENFFTPAGEKDGKFRTVQVDMMNAKQSVPYYNDGVFHGIALAYKDRRFKMLALTPVRKETPLSQLVRLLSEKGVEHFIQNSSRKNQTVIKLPKLKLSGDVDLKHLFSTLGMNTLFNAQHGDLTGIVQGKNLYISEARQILKLDLDEKGSEVAAVTYTALRMTSAGPKKEELNHFYADHPFILVLWDSETNAVLLTAAVINP